MTELERRQITATLAGALAARRSMIDLREPRVLREIAEVAADLTAAIDEAEAASEARQLARRQGLRLADPEAQAELCTACRVVPMSRPGAGFCDACWAARSADESARQAAALDRNVALSVTFPCPGCEAEPGETCRGQLSPGETVHGVRMEQVRLHADA